jgi:hypothetical protein
MEPRLQLFLIVVSTELRTLIAALDIMSIQLAAHQLLLNHSFHKDMAVIKCTLFRVLGKKVKQLKQQEEF